MKIEEGSTERRTGREHFHFVFFHSVGYEEDPVELQMAVSSFSAYEVDKRRCLSDNGKLRCEYVERR